MHLNSDTLVLVVSCKSRPVPCLQSTALHLFSLQLSKAKDLNTYYNWYFDVPNKLLFTGINKWGGSDGGYPTQYERSAIYSHFRLGAIFKLFKNITVRYCTGTYHNSSTDSVGYNRSY